MSAKNNSLSEDYFNDVYRNSDDPWNFETSDYEYRKYESTIKALTEDLYNNVFEIGCSIGVLSEMLAAKCEKLLAVDVAEAPLVKAKQRLQKYPHVLVQKMAVPKEFPADQFDLIVLSEVGYYLAWPDFELLQQQILIHLKPNAQLLMVHWTPFVPDYPLTGDEVHDAFMKLSGATQPLKHLLNQRKETYRLDLFEKQ